MNRSVRFLNLQITYSTSNKQLPRENNPGIMNKIIQFLNQQTICTYVRKPYEVNMEHSLSRDIKQGYVTTEIHSIQYICRTYHFCKNIQTNYLTSESIDDQTGLYCKYRTIEEKDKTDHTMAKKNIYI